MPPYGWPQQPHGSPLVRYPHELHFDARPEAPSWLPVAAWTFFFGVFGAISAARRTTRAHRAGRSGTPYWVAFAVTLVVSGVLWTAAAAIAVPTYLSYREDVATKALQSDLVHGERIAQVVGTTVNSAECRPEGARAATGLRAYTCRLALADGRTGTVRVIAQPDGTWAAG